ncbi:MAG: prolyl oligopeptidase family serine peptidase [Chromatiales bacterium]|nr:prolyl oligopeptidase family serine peptidase [Chromatiales bacterium]
MAALPGKLSAQTLNGAPFTSSLPGGVVPRDPAPLVISLHYGGPVSPYYGRGLLESVVEPALRDLGAVMIAPDCPEPTWTSAPCEATVTDVMTHVQANYSIDPKRILLTGYSKGGIGTWALAARYPERFTAAIVIAGRPPKDLDAGTWQLPMHVVHSHQDELLSIAPVTDAVAQLKAAGAPVEMTLLEGITHFETDRFTPPLRSLLPWLKGVWGDV